MKVGRTKRRLWLIEFAFFCWYSFGRKYRISSRERPRLEPGEGVNFTYGEAPWSMLENAFDHISPHKSDLFLELGSGIGRLSFSASLIYGVKVVGIEAIPTFVRRAKWLRRWLGLDRLEFHQRDFFDVSWAQADILYVTATTFTQQSLDKMNQKIGQIKDGAWLICLTHRLQHSDLVLQHSFVADCSWGAATLFLYRKLPRALPQ